MLNPDQRTLQAVHALQTDPASKAAFAVFMGWIQGSILADLGRAGTELDDVKVRRAQGAFLELSDLKKKVEEARDSLVQIEIREKEKNLPRV